MLSKENRLTKKKDFDAVFKKGKTKKHGFLICKILKSRFQNSRFGFVISKKVSAKAVTRNTIRRKLKSAVHRALGTIQSPIDVVIVVLPGIVSAKFLDIQTSINICLNS